MTFTADAGDAQFGPWNPGIQSQIPAHLRHYCTIFRPENVFTSLADAEEMRDLTGLEFTELVTFQPRRLALHEVLIRVTADLSVPDGSRIEDLGINFRQMTGVLLKQCIEPRMSEIDAIYDAAKRRLSEIVANELASLDAAPTAASTPVSPTAKREFLNFFKRARAPAVIADSDARDLGQLIATWGAKAHSLPDGAEQAAYRALSTVVSAVAASSLRHSLLTWLATILAATKSGG